ncbi:MAG: hypothetical protein GX608_07770, partial [Lentisphaerae bacterium]|nr:hypothetical protein [Lentisphaerota bacterium]
MTARECVDRALCGSVPLLEEGTALLSSETADSQAPSPMRFCAIKKLSRFEHDDAAFAAAAARLFSTLSLLGARALLTWHARQDGGLALTAGFDQAYFEAALAALQAAFPGIGIERSAPPPVAPNSSMWALEGTGNGKRMAAVDEALGCLAPGMTASLLLVPHQTPRGFIQRIDALRTRLSRYGRIAVQATQTAQHTQGTAEASGTVCMDHTARSISNGDGEVRLRGRSSSRGRNAGVRLFADMGVNEGLGQAASIAHSSSTNAVDSAGRASGNNATHSASSATTTGESAGENVQLQHASVGELDKRLARRRARLDFGESSGSFLAAYYVCGEEPWAKAACCALNAALCACEDEGRAQPDIPSAIRRLPDGAGASRAVFAGQHPEGYGRICLPAEIMCFVPMRDQPGLSVDEEPEFSRNIAFDAPDGDTIDIGR